MARNISFAMTTQAVRNRTKTVTRRNGWEHLKFGEVLHAVVKSQGLKRGETVERITDIRVVSIVRERLDRLVTEPAYGAEEMILEGFPELTSQQFVDKYCAANHCDPDKIISRIEFTYTD